MQDNIAQFIQAIRLENQGQNNECCDENSKEFACFLGKETRSSEDVQHGVPRQSTDWTDMLDQVKDRAEKTIIEAEKFRAAIVDPPGTVLNHNHLEGVNLCSQPEQLQFVNDNPMQMRMTYPVAVTGPDPQMNVRQTALMDIGKGVSDDDFFHLTCHIEPSLIHKIEKGEFVELEKLLPKDRLGHYKGGEENRLEWVQRDGGTYLVPAMRDNKITSIRKWEQAFRAYATIYSGANPHRAKEIWQYISVINTAAASFMWDNVYNYDITFRHLMAFNPQRSWAITYNQMWNLSMKDPLPKSQQQRYSSGNNGSNQHQSNGKGNSGGKNKHHKSDYCWSFNRGVKCKFGNRCKFIERCSYCDSGAHGLNICPKKKQKAQGNNESGGAANTH